ncbi:MAG: PQQ-binding-like beta-propeller repeat protein [Ignavibacteriaceae bacterium]|nr:PQQ-binding-like beta-propeller repeat protein [Ignavibacteriaceae bacterium]
MKNKIILLLILLFITILITGCARSVIKYSVKLDENPFKMFGKNSAREFYIPTTISDSLVLKWENEMYGSFLNSSVSVYSDLVFINDLSGRIFCYQFDTGNEIGKLKYGTGSVYSTPIPYKNKIIFPVAIENENVTELVYYDYNDGKELNNIELPGRVLTQMIADSNNIYFTTEIGAAYKFTSRGRKIWETHTRVPTRSSPALKNNLLIFGNDKGEIIALDSENGDSVYAKKIGGAFFSGLTISDSLIYVGNNNGNLYALALSSGEIIWQFDSGARIFMNPAVDDKNVFIGNLEGMFYSINKADGKQNWKINFTGLLDATPLITDNIIILPDIIFALHLIDKNDGRVIKSISLEGRAKLTPVIHDSTLFIGFDDGVIRAYEFSY